MAPLLLYTIPIAVAIALSVFPIVSVLILLLSPDALSRSVPFALGWPMGLLLLVTSFTLGATFLPTPSQGHFPAWVHVVEICLGVVLVATPLILPRGTRPPADHRKLTGMVSKLTPTRAFSFGLLMNARPKNLVLTVAAGIAIGAAPIDPVDTVLTVIVFVAVSASAVAGLVIAYAIGGNHVKPALERLRGFILAHASAVLRVLVIGIGVVLIVVGIAQLATR